MQPQAKPSKDHQGQVSLIATHRSSMAKMPPKDPKAQLAVELGPQGCTLQEQCPGACTQAPSQKRAQSGCWLRPHQLLDGKLAGANKAKAASQPALPMLGMSLVRLTFCKGTAIPLDPSQKVLDMQKMGLQEATCKNKISLCERLHMPLEPCPQHRLLRNKSNGMILPCT